MNIRLLSFKEVRKTTSLSRTSIWRLERRNQFPKRVQISPGCVGWEEEKVQQWIKDRLTVGGTK